VTVSGPRWTDPVHTRPAREGGVGLRDVLLSLDPTLAPCPAVFGVVWAGGISPSLNPEERSSVLAPLLEEVEVVGSAYGSPQVRDRVRAMLRHGKYKPSGRGKPASEFLLQAAVRGTFPQVNGPVDVNNAISLRSGFPGSVFDAAISGTHLLARRGREGEKYVFNPAGQTIDLEDLLLLCRRTKTGWEPCGNPVKDAMVTKISAATVDVIAVLYMPVDEPLVSAETWSACYADLLRSHCRAESSGWSVVCPESDAGAAD
jgi:DNA/RNA-binding domain of Phe-tRNA-synthetase-like protein